MTKYRYGLFTCLIVVLGAVASASGQYQRYPNPDALDPYVGGWNNRRPLSPSKEDFLTEMLLNEFRSDVPDLERRIDDDEGIVQTEPIEVETLYALRFPKLSEKHRDFAVHPGYLSYYNPELRHVENELDRKKEPRVQKPKSTENSEIAEDPFNEANKLLEQSESQLEQVLDDSFGDQIFKKTGGHQAEIIRNIMEEERTKDVYFTITVAACSAVAAFAIVLAGVVYHRMHKNAKAAEDVEYPAYGVTGPGKETSPTAGGDRKLAQNAQMYHYQHQKQQMIAFDSHQNGANRNRLASDEDSDEGEEGDYTVYECPGLAPTGEMEVRNPMFSDDQTTPKASQK